MSPLLQKKYSSTASEWSHPSLRGPLALWLISRAQYLYIRHNNLYLLALTKRNTNAAEILLFLHKIVEVFTEYFKELEEESIRDNFVVIYELLDEMMDFGYPQTTESKILQE